MTFNRNNAITAMADLTKEIQALIRSRREQLIELGRATPEALEVLAREDAEAERTYEIVQRVLSGEVSPDERQRLGQQLMHMAGAERLRGMIRPSILN